MTEGIKGKLLKTFIEKPARYAVKDTARFLKNTAVLSYTVSSLGMAGGIAMNKKIPDKEKKFMVFQEIMEGIINIAIFASLATSFERLTNWLIKTQRVIPAQGFPAFAKGLTAAMSLTGTIIGMNIVTPTIRNPFASYLRKTYFKHQDKKEDKTALHLKG